jgi:hypothetical protein
MPVNFQRRIIPANRNFISWPIKLIAFVEKIRRLRENGKPVGKTPGNPELPEVIIAKFNRYMLAECGAADPDVDRDVQDATSHDSDKLSLRVWIL